MAKKAPSRELILSDAELAQRMRLLAELREALHAAGVACVLARKHRLVLRYNDGPLEPSGLTNPELHIFNPHGTAVATSDGAVYRLGSGNEFAVADPAAVADAICAVT